MEVLYSRLAAGLDAARKRHRSHPAYFWFRHAMEVFDSLPEGLPLGLDFDCLIRRPA
jgi:hypothetical protein